MNMLYWMFDCLFLHRLDCATDLNVKVKFWACVAIFPVETIGKLASRIHLQLTEGNICPRRLCGDYFLEKGLFSPKTSNFLILLKISVSSLYSNSWAVF